jgi:murein DD-endopeptidase MepM/ murein hydrolase activator NlpD
MLSLFRCAVLLVFLSYLPVTNCVGQVSTSAVTLTPALVEAGSPEVVRVRADRKLVRVEGEWLGHTLQFFPGRTGNAWFAIAGVDVEAAAGSSQLTILEYSSSDKAESARQFSTQVLIHPAHYRTAAISVEPKFVEPGVDALKEIEAESKLKAKLFATSADRPLWSGSFEAPVKAKPTDSFGTRRTFNGKLASIHKGTDFRAASGTPVMAGNSGKVILAQALYYEGNCVMIDHGLGLTSISMHLSRIDVKPGQMVEKGQRIGLSGATGRVTGPHLHWAIRWDNSYLDPAKLLRLDLNTIH